VLARRSWLPGSPRPTRSTRCVGGSSSRGRDVPVPG
jgi:hypothetical protein